MLFRVVLITLVFATTVLLHRTQPAELAAPSTVALFAIVATTYGLTLVYAAALPRVANPIRFADAQIAGDLLVTAALVHLTGGAQSGYVFFFALSIIGTAMVRYRAGTWLVAGLSVLLYVGVSLAGWLEWLPTPRGQRVLPWHMARWELVRHLVLNSGAFVAVGALASFLGHQLASTGASLLAQKERSADLAALNEDIIRCLSSGLITVDLEGRILTFNHAAEEILGVSRTTALERPVAEVAPALAAVLTGQGAQGVLRRGEVAVPRPGGDPLTLGVSVSPLFDHRGTPIGRIMNFQDLTELRRMEAQMARAQRLAAVGELAAGIAHEIRNPLASISGSLELLRQMPAADEDGRALMGIVLREVDRLNALVTDLLEYARPRERMPVAMDLATLLDETVRVFVQDRAASHVAVKVEAKAGEVVLSADPAQLRQVVWNLLRNAAEAMPGGGEIRVAARRLPGDPAWCELSVADQGSGISSEDQERIFQPFYTTKTRGTGLGLAIVHRIVTEHGGTIAVESAPSRGATFTVRLPVG